DGDSDNIPDGGEFTADVSSYNNYYSFGSPMPGRSFVSATGYRYNFNGKESDPEVVGAAGGTQDYGFRIYNPSLGRFLSVDPLTKDYPNWSPYPFAMNRPIDGIDLDGLEWKDSKGVTLTDAQLKKVRVYIFASSDFTDQAMVEYNNAVQKYGAGGVALSIPPNSKQFAEDWGNMAGEEIAQVTIDFHGKNQSIKTDGDQLTSTGDGKTNIKGTPAMNIQDLSTPKGDISNAELQLNTCHSTDMQEKAHGEGDHQQGDLKGTKQTVAQAFREKFDFKNVRGTAGATNYSGGPLANIMNAFIGFLGIRTEMGSVETTVAPVPENGKWDNLPKK
ncbi:MAG: RHS repeat-associated core domain-containing protein, partial [Bacteroidota bacterium]